MFAGARGNDTVSCNQRLHEYENLLIFLFFLPTNAVLLLPSVSAPMLTVVAPRAKAVHHSTR